MDDIGEVWQQGSEIRIKKSCLEDGGTVKLWYWENKKKKKGYRKRHQGNWKSAIRHPSSISMYPRYEAETQFQAFWGCGNYPRTGDLRSEQD